jgi:RsiW-degrading membrane proteinase PrsW (M82 family)
MLLGFLISLGAAFVPTLLYVLLFYWADRYEREPLWLAFIAFVWGALPAIIISIVAETTLGVPLLQSPGPIAADLMEGAVVAPIVEELAKGMALLWIFYRYRQEFDGVLDGVLYGALVGFGFAMTENFFYFIGAFVENGWAGLTVLIFLRAIVFGLNHAFYTSLMGIGLGIARNRPHPLARGGWILSGLLAAMLAHAFHNLGAGLTAVNALGIGLSLFTAAAGLGLLLLTVGLSWQHERNIIYHELSGEVDALLTADELAHLTGRWRRPVHPKQAARTRMLIEFANRKRRLRLRGHEREPELAAELATLRAQLAPTPEQA